MKRKQKQHHVAAQPLTAIIFGEASFANQTDRDHGPVSAQVSTQKKCHRHHGANKGHKYATC
jgi:hypothetical protein